MFALTACVMSYFDLFVSDANRVTFLFTPVVTLLNIILYRLIGIALCPDFVTVSWIDSVYIITLPFLKSSNMSVFFMDFLGNSKRKYLLPRIVKHCTLIPNVIGMSTFWLGRVCHSWICMCCWQDDTELFAFHFHSN